MAFKFNFLKTEDVIEIKDSENIEWLSSEQILPSNQIKDLDVLATRAKIFTCGDIEIGHVVVNNVVTSLEEKGLKNLVELSESEHSDLVTGKYEGGLKIWECTYDLIEYFEDHVDFNFEDTKVLDLGCGAGILGIYAFLKGAAVTFQDYNKEILEYCTIPNVLLNIEEEQRENAIKRCKFYSGDWASFDKLLKESDTYDIILTSETIYNLQNYNKLITLFQNRLSHRGSVYVSAKTYYFGVGGGMRQFEDVLKGTNFTSQIVKKTNSGIQREILKINKL